MDLPFSAILPKTMRNGDEVLLKGFVFPDADHFSVNFALSNNERPEDIAYHFKVSYIDGEIIQNYKTSNQWHEEIVDENIHFNLDQSTEFKLIFVFYNSRVLTYRLGDDDYSRIDVASFPLPLFLEEIKSVQLWGDVERITEFTCRYA